MTYPIRVLHVVTIMNLGGVETLLMSLYRNIDRTKIQFDFLVHRSAKGVFDDEILKLGGRIYYSMPLVPHKVVSYNTELLRFLKEHPEYKIIHSHLNANSTLVLRIAKKAKVPVRIAHAHIDSPSPGGKGLIENVVKKPITNYSTKNFSCSKSAGNWLFGINSDYEVFNNGIETERFVFNPIHRNEVRENLSINKDEIVIGHIGRFFEQKNHRFLIDVFSEFIKLNPQSKLLLIGEGELQDEIKTLSREKGIEDNIIFTGAIKNANEYLSAMDLFLFPSLFEGLGIVLIEAQCNGLPILMTDTLPKEAELVRHLVFRKPLNDAPNEWAQKMQEILIAKQGADRSVYRQTIINGGYDASTNAERLQDFYLKQVELQEKQNDKK